MFKTKTRLLCFLFAAVILMKPSSSTADGFIYGGCSPAKFTPGSAYETNLNSLFASFITSTVVGRYDNITVPSVSTTKPEPGVTVYGIYQCRGDLDPSSCSSCVSRAISQVGALCLNTYSGFLQMESCFVRYDNSSFFGVQDKTLMLKKCAPFNGFDDQDALTKAGDVIGYLGSGNEPYRTSGNGDVKGVAQCTGDLSPAQCQDCLTDAIGRLRSDCGMSQSGSVYLSKCYAQFSCSGGHARQSSNFAGGDQDDDDDHDNSIGKTLAIIIGTITLVILLVVFLAFVGKQCRKLQDEKCCTSK